MTTAPWPQDVVDAINWIGIDNPTCCGECKPGLVSHGGCLKAFDDPIDRYKCVDCGVTFHRECAREHFRRSGDQTEKLREHWLMLIAAIRRAPTAFTVESLLDAFEKMARQ